MKKISFILAGGLIISIALAACSGSKEASSTITTQSTASNIAQQSSEEITNENKEDIQATNKSEEAKDLEFNLVTATYVKDNVKIKYPQITGFKDSNKQSQINDLIKSDILNEYKKDVTIVAENYYDNNYKKAEAALTEYIDYDIKLNSSKLLSIQYVKNEDIPGSAHPYNELHSININIENGAILKFKELININYGFVEKLKNGKNKVWTARALAGDEFNELLAEEISDGLRDAYDKDLIDQFNKEDYSFYFTKDRFGMSYWVSHASGDYANIEIKYNDLKENINTENSVWKDFIAELPTGGANSNFTVGNIKDIKSFTPFESQCFMVNLDSWGEVKFVAGEIPTSFGKTVTIYLTNKDGDILYDFNSGSNALFHFDVHVEAVSFQDVNKDGLKDIIIISAYNSKASTASGKTIAAVYFQKNDKSFAADSKLNGEINDSGSNKDIKSVVKYLLK